MGKAAGSDITPIAAFPFPKSPLIWLICRSCWPSSNDTRASLVGPTGTSALRNLIEANADGVRPHQHQPRRQLFDGLLTRPGSSGLTGRGDC